MDAHTSTTDASDASCESATLFSDRSDDADVLHIIVSVDVHRRTGRLATLAAVPVLALGSAPRDETTPTAFCVQIDGKATPTQSAYEFPSTLSPRRGQRHERRASRSWRRSRSASVSHSAELAQPIYEAMGTPPPALVDRGALSAHDAITMFVGWLCRNFDVVGDSGVVLWLPGPVWRLVDALQRSFVTNAFVGGWLFDGATVQDARAFVSNWSTGLDWSSRADVHVAWNPPADGVVNDALGTTGSALDTVLLMQRVLTLQLANVSRTRLCAGGRSLRDAMMHTVPLTINTLDQVCAVVGVDASLLRVRDGGAVRELWDRVKRRGRLCAEDYLRGEVLAVDRWHEGEAIVDFFEAVVATRTIKIKAS